MTEKSEQNKKNTSGSTGDHNNERMQKAKGRTKQIMRVGLFFLLGLVVLLVGIFVMGDRQNLFSNTFPVYANFRTVEGLKTGAAVMLSGIRVGTVTGIELNMDTTSYVRVDMIIEEDYHNLIRTSAVAAIGQEGFIGDKLVEILLSDVNSPIVRAGDSINGAPPTNYFEILDKARIAVENTNSITASLDTLFMRFRRGEGTLGKLLTDDAAYNSLVDVSNSANELFTQTGEEFAEISQTLGKAADNVDAITVESRKLISDMAKGKGTVGALLYDRSLYDSLETLTGILNQTASSAGFAAREFGINMRGLRNNWLVGGLFSGGEEEERNVELLQKELELRLEEIERQKQLLEQRQQELVSIKRSSNTNSVNQQPE